MMRYMTRIFITKCRTFGNISHSKYTSSNGDTTDFSVGTDTAIATPVK
jgi:hypothetical protein